MGKRLAMLSGTFAAAWAHSKAVTTPFCWLWVEESVDGLPVCKPIWHVGGSAFVDATGATAFVEGPPSVPAAPTITMSEQPVDGKYPKGTIVTIAPDPGSALYYSVNGGTTKVSDVAVAITLDTAGVTISIDAYCVNQAGTSATHATQTIVVQGVSTPQWSQESGSVTRGGSVTISPQDGGTLYYSVDGGTEQSSNSAVTIPITNQNAQSPTTIVARNVVDGTSSASVTKTFYMAALEPPSMTMSPTTDTPNEFPATGGTVELTGEGDYIFYTTDGSTPTTSSTRYTGAISVTARTTIKAIAHDDWGDSAVATATYTIAVAKIKVKVNADTTMNLGETGLDEIPLSAANNNGVNEFTPSDLGITSFADHEFASLSFGDNTKIVTFDGGGMKVKSLNSTFSFDFSANGASLTEVKGIVVVVDKDGNGNITGGGDVFKAFNEAQNLTYLELSGIVNGNMQYAFHRVGFRVSKCVIDISGLEGKPSVLTNAFDILKKTDELDISGIDTSAATQMNSVFEQGAFAKLVIGNFADSNAVDNNVFAYFAANKFTTLECKSQTPPSLKASNSWLKQLADTQSSFTTIIVPDGCLGDASDSTKYAGADVWKDYASKMVEKSNYNNN